MPAEGRAAATLHYVLARLDLNVYALAIDALCLRFIHVGPCHIKLPALDAVSDTLLPDTALSIVAKMKSLLLKRGSQASSEWRIRHRRCVVLSEGADGVFRGQGVVLFRQASTNLHRSPLCVKY
jgi:hypothetical protein